jgi:hypothetical protein
MKTFELDGKKYPYDDNTKFRTEVGRGDGPYNDIRYTCPTPQQAWMWYSGVNIGNGYKKRFVMIRGAKRTILNKVTS